MIISTENKFIYLRIPKTASASVIYTLSQSVPIKSYKLSKNNAHSKYTDIIRWSQIYKHDLSIYKIFTIIRNPYDRLAFMYFWFVWKDRPKRNEYEIFKDVNPLDTSFSMFLDYMYDTYPNDLNQINWIHRVPRDNLKIGRCHTLQQDFNAICKWLKIVSSPIPKINVSPIKYKGIYNSYNVQKVRKMCNADLKYFNFSVKDSVYVRKDNP